MRKLWVTLMLLGFAATGEAVAATPTAPQSAPPNVPSSPGAPGVVRPDTNVDPSMPVLKPRTPTTMPVVHPKTTTPSRRRDAPPTLVVPR